MRNSRAAPTYRALVTETVHGTWELPVYRCLACRDRISQQHIKYDAVSRCVK